MSRFSDPKLRKSRSLAVVLIWFGCFLVAAVFPWEICAQTVQRDAHESQEEARWAIDFLVAIEQNDPGTAVVLLVNNLLHAPPKKGIRRTGVAFVAPEFRELTREIFGMYYEVMDMRNKRLDIAYQIAPYYLGMLERGIGSPEASFNYAMSRECSPRALTWLEMHHGITSAPL